MTVLRASCILFARLFLVNFVWRTLLSARCGDSVGCPCNHVRLVRARLHCTQVTNALQHVPHCMAYMSLIRDPAIFRFCAIPQIMAVGTLAQVYNNGKVFEGGSCDQALRLGERRLRCVLGASKSDWSVYGVILSCSQGSCMSCWSVLTRCMILCCMQVSSRCGEVRQRVCLTSVQTWATCQPGSYSSLNSYKSR